MNRSADGERRGSRRGSRARPPRSAASGRRASVPDRVRCAAGPRGIRGRRARAKPASSSRAKPSGSWIRSASACPSCSASSRRSAHEGHRPGRRLAARRIGCHRSTACPRAGHIAAGPEAVSILELRLRSLGRRRRTGRRRTRGAAVATSTIEPAVVDQPPAHLGDPALGPDGPANRNGTPEVDVEASGHAPVSAPTSDQAMTSSRIVHRMPPWAMPSQPWKRCSSVELRPRPALAPCGSRAAGRAC